MRVNLKFICYIYEGNLKFIFYIHEGNLKFICYTLPGRSRFNTNETLLLGNVLTYVTHYIMLSDRTFTEI